MTDLPENGVCERDGGLKFDEHVIVYDFATGAHNSQSAQMLDGPAEAFGVRFVADVPRDVGLSVVFTDADGQTHVRQIRTAVGGPEAYTALFARGRGPHWGGKNDGKVRLPVRSLKFSVENRLKNIPGGAKGQVTISSLRLFADTEKDEGAFDEAGFAALQREVSAFKRNLPSGRAKGAAVASVAEDFFGWIRDDLSHGLTNRAMRELHELQRLVRNETARQQRVDGGSEKDFPAAAEKTFGVGYGHFQQAVDGLERMQALGMDIIQIEVGPWHVFPEEGVVNTNALDRFSRAADKAEKLGMKICLLVSPHYFPEWMLAKHPELKPCGDGMMHYCVHSPVAQDLLKRYLEFVIPRVRGRKALHSICLSNEPVMSAWNEKCALQPQLTAWLKGRYADIAALNAKWKTTYAAFEDIRLPKNFYAFKPRSPEALELTRFNRERFAAFHGWMAEVIHALAPEIPVHAKIMLHANFHYGTSFYSVDPELFAPFSGFGGNDCATYPAPESPLWAHEFARMEAGYDYLRSVSRAPVFNTENHIIDDRERRDVAPEHCYATLWQNAIHGQTATTIWLWERVFDKARMSDPNGLFLERPDCLAATGFAALDLNRLARPVSALAARKPTVLLHWSLASLVLDNRDGAAFLDAYRAASCLGQPLGVVTEKMLSDFVVGGKRTGVLEDVRSILLPDASHLPDAVRAGLKRLAAEGVPVVAAGLKPTANDFLEPRPGDDFRFLGDLCGEALAKALFEEAARWNLPSYPRARTDSGGVPYGVESNGIELDGVRYLSLVNHRNAPQTVRLPSAGVDLITGAALCDVMELKPLQTILWSSALTGLTVDLPVTCETNADVCVASSLPTGAGSFVIELPRGTGGPTVRAADFGFSPTNDACQDAITRAAEECRRLGAARLELAPGTYRCYGSSGVRLLNLRDVTVDGKGAQLVFRRPAAGAQPNFLLRGCERVELRDFTMDWDWEKDPLGDFVEVTDRHVGEKADGSSWFDVRFPDLERHPVYPNPLAVAEFNPMTLTPEGELRFRDAVPNANGNEIHGDLHSTSLGAKSAWLSPNTLRVWPHVRAATGVRNATWDCFFSPEKNLRTVRDIIRPGATYRMLHYYYGEGAFNMDSNRDLTLRNVTVWSCRGHGFCVQGSQTRWQFLNVKLTPPPQGPGSRRVVTATSDGTHVVQSNGYCLYDGCEFRLTNDDTWNFHDVTSPVRRADARTLTCVSPYGTSRVRAVPGDVVELAEPDFSPISWRARIVTVAKDAFTVDTDIPAGDGIRLLFDRSHATTHVWLRKCTVEDTHHRGLLYCHDTTIENCVFRRTGSHALSFEVYYNLERSAEGSGVTNVVVRGCTFDETERRINHSDSPTLRSSCSVNPWKLAPKVLHRGVFGRFLVEDCRFLNPRGMCLKFNGVSGLTFRNNLVDLRADRGNPRFTQGWLGFENSEGVRIENNRWTLSSSVTNRPAVRFGGNRTGFLMQGNQAEWVVR